MERGFHPEGLPSTLIQISDVSKSVLYDLNLVLTRHACFIYA